MYSVRPYKMLTTSTTVLSLHVSTDLSSKYDHQIKEPIKTWYENPDHYPLQEKPRRFKCAPITVHVLLPNPPYLKHLALLCQAVQLPNHRHRAQRQHHPFHGAVFVFQRRPVRRELLVAPHGGRSTRQEVDLGRDGTAHLQSFFDPVFEVLAHEWCVLSQGPEDVAANEGGTGLGVDDEHVEDVGRVVLDREMVIAEDQIL